MVDKVGALKQLVLLFQEKDYPEFNTELKTVFELCALRERKEEFQKYVNEHEECRDIDGGTCQLIGNITNDKRLLTWLQAQTKQENIKEKKVDMCKTINGELESERRR